MKPNVIFIIMNSVTHKYAEKFKQAASFLMAWINKIQDSLQRLFFWQILISLKYEHSPSVEIDKLLKEKMQFSMPATS